MEPCGMSFISKHSIWSNPLPDGWRRVRAKHVFRKVDIRSETGLEELLSVSSKYGVIKRSLANVTMFKAASYIGHKLCWEDDLVINSLWAWSYGLGVSRYHGIVSTAYGVYRIKSGIKGNPDYLNYLLRSAAYQWEFMAHSKGIWKSRLQLTDDAFFNIPMILPTFDIQNKIVHYLDHKNHLTNKLISVKKKQIELLIELRQAIINDAVTGKTDVSTGKPYHKYKDSGVDWLGQIPEQWSVEKPTNLFNFKKGTKAALITRSYIGANQGIYPVYSGQTDNYGILGEIDWFEFDYTSPVILVTTVGAKVMTTRIISGKFSLSQNCAIITSKNSTLDIEFFNYALETMFGYEKRKISLIMQPSLRFGDFAKFRIPFPDYDEQRKISRFIRSQIENIDNQIRIFEQVIQSLKELQTRLISDVVTGKLDVRSMSIFIESKSSDIPFKRNVLAAEIIKQLYMEPTLGHVKFQKVLFLSERLCQLDIGTNYHRAAAGPHDSKALKSIDEQLSNLCWYEAQEIEGRFKYLPLAKAGEHEKYFVRYFSDIEEELNRIISILRPLDTERCEMIATLFSAWEDLLGNNVPVNDDNIIHEVTENWADSKKRIAIKRWSKCLTWMKENHITPLDIGRFNAD